MACSIELQDEETYNKVMKACKENYLIVGRGSNNKIVFRPPYVIMKEQIDKVIDVFEKALCETKE